MTEPPVWTTAELSRDAETAKAAFRTRRLREPLELYSRFFESFAPIVSGMVDRLPSLTGGARLETQAIAEIIADDELRTAFRYLAAPPISMRYCGHPQRRRSFSSWTQALLGSMLLCRVAERRPAADERGIRDAGFPWWRGMSIVNALLRGAVAAVALFGGAAAWGDALDSGDSAWILTSTALVLFMTIPGLALFYGGLVRANNVLSVLLQCFAITCMVTILWLVAGYSLAFGDTVGGAFGSLSKYLYNGVAESSLNGTIPESIFATFQLTFAIITPALIIGAFAERMRFSAVLLFTALWSLLIYSPVAHWVWGGGWLGEMGLMDFAGGTVVHVTAGTAAVVAAMVLGPRRGFPGHVQPPHNMTLTVAGAAMLWVGWFGFNGGSALAANGDAAMALTVTHISAAAGAFTWMLIEWLRYGKPSALGAVTGMVAGLGTITPASGFVGPAGALVIGIAAGAVCLFATTFMKQKLKIDDTLDVFPVHGVGGALGTILTGVFASSALGVFSGQEGISIPSQLGVQALGVLAVVAYTAVGTWVLLKVTGAVVGNRVSDEEETEGLDLVAHNERGYIL